MLVCSMEHPARRINPSKMQYGLRIFSTLNVKYQVIILNDHRPKVLLNDFSEGPAPRPDAFRVVINMPTFVKFFLRIEGKENLIRTTDGALSTGGAQRGKPGGEKHGVVYLCQIAGDFVQSFLVDFHAEPFFIKDVARQVV